MDPTHSESQAAEQQWLDPASPTNHDKFLEQRIEELEQLTKGTDVFQVSHPDNLFWHRYADHGLRIYTHGDDHDDSKQLLTRIPLFTNYHGEADTQSKIEILLKLQKLLSEAYESFPDEYIGVEIFMAENNVNA